MTLHGPPKMQLLENISCHDDANFVVIGGTAGYCCDNFFCRSDDKVGIVAFCGFQWVYPIKYAWSFVVFCFVVAMLSVHLESPLQWHHNGRNSVSNHQPYNCLLNCLLKRTSKKTSKLHITGLCVGNSPVTGKFSAQRASNVENVSIWWRHHDRSFTCMLQCCFTGTMGI